MTKKVEVMSEDLIGTRKSVIRVIVVVDFQKKTERQINTGTVFIALSNKIDEDHEDDEENYEKQE